jgi:hypothetical protein
VKASRCCVIALGIVLFTTLFAPAQRANAGLGGQYGKRIVSGTGWLSGQGVDVCGNDKSAGTSTDCDNMPGFVYGGLRWQCVELAQRLYNKLGWHSGIFSNVGSAYQIYDLASQLGMQQKPNNGGYKPVPGDMIIHDAHADNKGFGHVSVVDYTEGGVVHVVEQNASSTGRADYAWSASGLSRAGFAPIRGIVHDPDNTLVNPPPPVDPATRNPFGAVNSVRAVPGGVHVVYWAIDPDVGTGAIWTDVYINGVKKAQIMANQYRADVQAAFPQYGGHHGVDTTLATSGYGKFEICVYGINGGPGTTNPLISPCSTIFHAYPPGYGHRLGQPYQEAFPAAYNSVGGQAVMGHGQNPVHDWGPGCTQDFNWGSAGKGAIMQRACMGAAYAVTGAFWNWRQGAWGGSAADVGGYPYTYGHRYGDGWTQDFDGGKLGVNMLMIGDRVGRVHLVFGAIRHEYVRQNGANGIFKYPVTNEYAYNGGSRQDFEGGSLAWHKDRGVYRP